MAKADINYSALANESNPFNQPHRNVHSNVVGKDDEGETELDTDNDDIGPNSEIMIHVVPDTSKTRWNHIEDLDSFFTRMYHYHQRHGFTIMMLQELFELGQFVFAVVFITFLFNCVNYPVLFREDVIDYFHKITISDAIYSPGKCYSSLGGFTWFLLGLSSFYWLFRLIKVCYHAIQFWDVKKFYNTALKIEDSELDNLTWHEVQRKIRDVQSEQQMCIHKSNLTELDIYHRILRFKNYMVAMMNKNIIPAKLYLPFFGEMVCYSGGLRYAIEMILFRGPWSPFENNWHLKEEYKRSQKRVELAQKLSRQIAYIAIGYLIFSPLIFFWELMVFFFSYADLIKREPGTLGMRCWSQYGKLYLRHLNELDHELKARLSRAYRPAGKYMSSFSSPMMAVVARNFIFICGGILSVLVLLTCYDEDVIQVEHVITLMSALTIIVIISRSFIPDENLIWCPEQLMTAVLAHTHYLPAQWRGIAHTSGVREQFGQFFQFRAIYFLNEILSPITTPIMLIFYLRPRSLDIVDFFRNFTVSVVGVGDVCSFAQMDLRKHGNPEWQPSHSTTGEVPEVITPVCETNQYTQGEHGKTELSLVHYTLTNPEWKMPSEAKHFLKGLRKHAQVDMEATRMGMDNAMEQSLLSVGSINDEYSTVVNSILYNQRILPQMGLSSNFCRSVLRNPFSPTNNAAFYPMEMSTQRSTLADINEDDDGQAAAAAAAHADPQAGPSSYAGTVYGRTTQSFLCASMGASMRSGGLSRVEGPSHIGSHESLLHSLYNMGVQQSTMETRPTGVVPELTTVDMCLNTLYLHELHHRQIQRRGLRLEQSQRHMWQRPHQQYPGPMSASVDGGSGGGGGGGGGSGVASGSGLLHTGNVSEGASRSPLKFGQSSSITTLAEKTPLLGSRKS